MEIIAKYYKTIVRDKSGKYKACGYNYYKELCMETTYSAQPILTEMDLPSGVKRIESGSYSTHVLMNDGTLKVIGYNSYGQLGLGHKENVTELTDIPNISGVKNVYCGYYHTILLMEDGSIMGIGYNSYGQLGLGHKDNITEFTKLPIDGDVKNIVCGDYNTLVLLEDGRLFVTGYNSNGQLGLGHKEHITAFTEVTDIPDNIKNIDCAGSNSAILTEDGKLYTCGYNYYGQLGLGLPMNSDNDVSKFTLVPDIENVKKVSYGGSHCLILLENGDVYGAGYNGNGQLGIYNTTNKNVFTKISYSNVKDISCGGSHSVIIDSSYRIRVAGYNYYGQLGIGDSGRNAQNQTSFTPLIDLYNTSLVACGDNSVFIDSSYGKFVAGSNYYGQLGVGDNKNKYIFTNLSISPIKKICIGSIHTVVLLESGHVQVTGDNSYGQLGLGTSSSDKKVLRFKYTSGGSDILDIACGNYHTILYGGRNYVMTTGSNDYGQLGTGNTTKSFNFKYINIPGDIKRVVAGGYSSYILRNDGTILCAGGNRNGQLGLGDTEDKTVFTEVKGITDVLDISAGASHTVLLLKDGTIMVSGSNSSGQLGLGDNDNRTTFTKVDGIIGVKKVVCGSSHTFLIMNDGTVKVAGYNSHYQLGLGDTDNRNTFEDVVNVKNIKDIAAGYYCTLFLDIYGCVHAVGESQYGQFGINGNGNGEKVIYTKPTKLPYIEKLLKRYLIKENNNYLTVSKDGTLEPVDGLDVYDLCSRISQYKDHLSDGKNLIKYIR